MPIGRKLKVDPGVVEMLIDYDEHRRELLARGTTCEWPDCVPLQAVAPYMTDWSFSFLCEGHIKTATSNTGAMKLAWDRVLAEHMMSLMLRHSYIHTNVESGFVLEQAIAARDHLVKEERRLEKLDAASTVRDLRRQINASTTAIGQADDDILTARQRQANRVAEGKKQPGPAPVRRAGLLLPRLIVGVSPPKEE